jgi:hypothetical protein
VETVVDVIMWRVGIENSNFIAANAVDLSEDGQYITKEGK